jgi:hypothetical protein
VIEAKRIASSLNRISIPQGAREDPPSHSAVRWG